ncbi:hypothetical protein P2W49_05770 [Yersinia intermedia]|nr:hypothetical protein P2W49_05770 [Yersinia intermedia]
MQSGVHVNELRKLNKGSLDTRDELNAGESLLLPANSPCFRPTRWRARPLPVTCRSLAWVMTPFRW